MITSSARKISEVEIEVIRYKILRLLLLLPIVSFIVGSLFKGVAFAATLSTTKPNLEYPSDRFKIAVTPTEQQAINVFLASAVPVGNNNYLTYSLT